MNDKTTKQKKAPAIDWAEVHRRVETLSQALETGIAPDSEKVMTVLKERATALAREEKEEKTGESIEIVEFILATERYGVETSYIEEVWPLKDFTPLPGTPAFVLGIINVRGRIVSVVDIKKFFDMPEKGISDLNKVIIIHDDKMELGILADEILGVRNIALSELGPPLPTLTGIRQDFLKGVTVERIVILDAARILADKNIVVHEEA